LGDDLLRKVGEGTPHGRSRSFLRNRFLFRRVRWGYPTIQ